MATNEHNTHTLTGLDIGPDLTAPNAAEWSSRWAHHRGKASEAEARRGERVRGFAGVGGSVDYIGPGGLTLSADRDPSSLTVGQLQRMADAILADADMACPVIGYRFDSKAEVVTVGDGLDVLADVAHRSIMADAYPGEARREARRQRTAARNSRLDVLQALDSDTGRFSVSRGLKRWPMRLRIRGRVRPRNGETFHRVETIHRVETARDLARRTGRTVTYRTVQHLTTLTDDGRVRHGHGAPERRPMTRAEQRADRRRTVAQRTVKLSRTVDRPDTLAAAVRAVVDHLPTGEARDIATDLGSVRVRHHPDGRWSVSGTVPQIGGRRRQVRNADAVVDLFATV